MNADMLKQENERLHQQNARLLSALEEVRSRLAEPEDVIRAIRQGEIDALVVQEQGQEEIYSLQRFDSVYRILVEECFPYGVWLAEPDGRLLYITPSFLEQLQTNLRDMQEKGQFHFLRPDRREAVEREWAKCRQTGTVFDVQYTVRFRGGIERTIWTHGIRTQTQDGLTRWVGFNIDMTEREKAKDQLRQQAEALQDADHRKDNFLATLAHELRNPLAPIRNAVELLRRCEGDAAVREQTHSMMARQVDQMVRLIDDLLDMSRISQGKVRLCKERVELQAVIRSAGEAVGPLIQAQAHQLTVTLPPEAIYLDADASRLAQVISNLLSNAAKYTEKGGHIWLTAERQGNEAVVSMRDTGIGIAAEHLHHIFEMFSQVAPVQERSQGGLGIGLALVRGLVELHGGRVEVRSDGIGRGSEFIVRLPVVEMPVRHDSPQLAEDNKVAGGRKRRILIVDDNRDATDSLAVMLKMMGHETRTAYDGLEAVQAAAIFRPEVVLLDIGLPKMNGYEAARHIRQQQWGESMALIAQTGWGQEEDKRRALEAGFDHHLTKPVEAAALEKLLALINPAQRHWMASSVNGAGDASE
jgi:signal transduction histidine kinase/ActR/RegA family two-component response regulator